MSAPAWARVPPGLRATVARLPQSAVVTRVAHRVTRQRLRVLGLHGVPDLDAFAALVDVVLRAHRPVDEEQVAAATRGSASLPDHAVWFTFDDGLASTFATGPLLADRGIRATAFVNPAVIARPGRLWFQSVDAAQEQGLVTDGSALKRRWLAVDDDVMRAEVADLEAQLSQSAAPMPDFVGVDHLVEWQRLGHHIGNHTWDHPFLDRCSPEAQTEQIEKAHRTLTEWRCRPTSFAYPNGNHIEHSERVLRDLGYALAVLFDHRLARVPGDPLRISRLRIDSDAGPRRALSILSGGHSLALGVAGI